MSKVSESAFSKAGGWLVSFVMLYVAIAVAFTSVERTPLVVGGVGVFLSMWAIESAQGKDYKGGGLPFFAGVAIVLSAVTAAVVL